MVLFSCIGEYYSKLSVYVLPFLNILTDHQWSCTMAMWPAPQPALIGSVQIFTMHYKYINLCKLTQKKQAMKLPANMTGIPVLRNPCLLLLS